MTDVAPTPLLSLQFLRRLPRIGSAPYLGWRFTPEQRPLKAGGLRGETHEGLAAGELGPLGLVRSQIAVIILGGGAKQRRSDGSESPWKQARQPTPSPATSMFATFVTVLEEPSTRAGSEWDMNQRSPGRCATRPVKAANA